MSNTFGRLLNIYRQKKQYAIEAARTSLEQRNGVDYKNAQTFKLEERELPMPNGKNVTEIRLWKLVDAAVVTIDPDVEVTTKGGVTALGDFHADPTHPLYIDPASLQDKPAESTDTTTEDDW